MEKKLQRKPFATEDELLSIFETAKSSKGMGIKIAKTAKEGIVSQLNTACMALEFAKGNLPAEHFPIIVDGLYDIKLDDEEDFGAIFTEATGKSYSKNLRLKLSTTMVKKSFEVVDGEVEWKDKAVSYLIAASDEFSDNRYQYTSFDIKRLVESGEIILLGQTENDIRLPHLKIEDYNPFPVHNNYCSASESNAFYPYIIDYLRQNIDDKTIVEDTHEFLSTLEERIDKTLNALEPCGSVRVQCEKELENSNIYERIEKLKKDATDIKHSMEVQSEKETNHAPVYEKK